MNRLHSNVLLLILLTISVILNIVHIPFFRLQEYEKRPDNILTKRNYIEKKSALSYKPFQTMLLNREKVLYNYSKVLKQLNEEKAAMDDPRLIEIIRDYFIDLPSTEEYNLKNPRQLEYSEGQAPFVDSRLNYIEDGFYVECGALDGETRSNTLFFEKVRKWNGILIEADPSNYAALKNKHRKTFGINVCLSPYPYPSILKFSAARNLGRIFHDDKVNPGWHSNVIEIQCFPLYSILLALNQTTVDYFSLDVEGDEFEVLKTIPFGKVNIKMLSVEYEHQNNAEMKSFMSNTGYELMLELFKESKTANDWIFRKKGLQHTSL